MTMRRRIGTVLIAYSEVVYWATLPAAAVLVLIPHVRFR